MPFGDKICLNLLVKIILCGICVVSEYQSPVNKAAERKALWDTRVCKI